MRTSVHRSALRPQRLTAWASRISPRCVSAKAGVAELAEYTRAHRRRAIVALMALGCLMVPADRAVAQYSVTQVQPLAFGYLTQGVTEVVPYSDAFRRGVVTVDGAGQAWVRLVLPVTLVSPQGSTIPLQFLTGDAATQENGKLASAFDPTGSTRVNLDRGTASIFIGGRAVPAINQRAGLYSAAMTIIVSPTRF